MINIDQLMRRMNQAKADEYEPADIAIIDGWIKQVEEFQAKESLSQNMLIRKYISDVKSEVEHIDEILKTKRKVDNFTEFDRELLLERKIMYTKFVQQFEADGDELKRLAQSIEDSLDLEDPL